MSKSICLTNMKTIYHFLSATDANWRNSIYVECSVCKAKAKVPGCGDFLFVPDEDGTPLLLPIWYAEIFSARVIDKSECLGLISNARFEDLFHKWLRTMAAEPSVCPLLDAAKKLHPPEKW